MLQNPCKTLGFKKNMFFEIPPGGGGEVNHIQPVAYIMLKIIFSNVIKSKEFEHPQILFVSIYTCIFM